MSYDPVQGVLKERLSFRPTSYKSVNTLAPYTLEERKFISTLLVFTPHEVFFHHGRFGRLFDLSPPLPYWFILQATKGYYLVYTAGLKRPYYMGKLNRIPK
jgi:hypothetical protein